MYIVFNCIDCKRSWTGLHNNRCPDVRCAGVCEVITPASPLPVQADYSSDQAVEKLGSLHLEAAPAKQAVGPNQHFYVSTSSENVLTCSTKNLLVKDQVEEVAESTNDRTGATLNAEVVALDLVHPEKTKKRKKKNKNKGQTDSTATNKPPVESNRHIEPPGNNKKKKKHTTSKNGKKSASQIEAEASRFKNVHLPLPDYLLPTTASSPTSSTNKASFADAVATLPQAFTDESEWTVVGARKIVKPKLTPNASSYLTGTEGGAFGTTVAPRESDERDQKSGVHRVEYDLRKAKHSVRTVVPRM